MPSKPRQKNRPRPSPSHRPASRHAKPKKSARSVPAKPAAKASRPPAAKSAPAAAAAPLEVPLPEGRRHVLSLSFVRDGDEFMARLETDAGHITELKNRSLDQLLTLVASELEDLLE
jgi:hypothetical protein